LFFLCAQLKAGEKITAPVVGEFKDVEFTQIEGERVRFKHKDGGGIIEISKLSKELQEKVKTLPQVDTVAKKTDEESRKQAEKVRLQRELETKYKSDFAGIIKGTVIQVIPDHGVLIYDAKFEGLEPKLKKMIVEEQEYIVGSSNFGRNPQYKTFNVEKLVSMRETSNFKPEQLVFISCDTEFKQVGRHISIDAYPIGNYTYTSVANGEKTVPAFTNHLKEGLEMFLASLQDEKQN
jgi:hypothetical protein